MTDVLLPLVGDTVSHRDLLGNCFQAKVLERHFDYALKRSEGRGEEVRVILTLQRTFTTSVP